MHESTDASDRERILLVALQQIAFGDDVDARGVALEALHGAGFASMRSWDDAAPMELLKAETQSLREDVQHLKDCAMWAFEQCAQVEGSPVRPEAVLDEEWSK